MITLNVDFDGEASLSQELIGKISQVLSDQGATCDNYIATTPMEDVLSKFDFFGLPAAILYDRSGNILQAFDGEVDIENSVKPTIQNKL